eukprot:15364857-Ditylum_brightwellii.AAC.3
MHYFEHSTQTNYICDVLGYGILWFHEKGTVNILLLLNVKKQYQVTNDSHGKDKFIVYKPEYQVEFIKSPSSLFYNDMSDMSMNFIILTVEGNMQMLTRKEYDSAVKARKIYTMVE